MSAKTKARPGDWIGREDDFQIAAVESARRILHANRVDPRLLWHPANGGFRSKKTAGRFKAMGVVAGVPDLVLCVARGGFHGLFVELKVRGNYARKTQKDVHEILSAQGYAIRVAYGCPEVDRIILDYLNGHVEES